MAASLQSEFDLAPAENISRVFLNWERPLLTAAVDYLTRDWSGGLLDLSSLVVILPTRNASRRLRESLALRAAEKGSGVLPPLILNPDDLLSITESRLPTATKTETLSAWIQILVSADLPSLPALFPVVPAEQSFSWALGVARDFMQVQGLLNEAAHNTSYVAKVAERHDLEPERWSELAKLENHLNSLLEKNGRQSRSATRRQALEDYELPAQCRLLVLLGLPDAPPALDPLVRRLSQTTETLVAIHAREADSDDFDELGHPLTPWGSTPLAIPESSLWQSANPASQAAWARRRIAEHPAGEAARLVAIGIPDVAVSSPLHKELVAADYRAFDPAGTPLSSHGLCQLLERLYDVTSSQTLGLFRELLRFPGIAESAGNHEVPAESERFSAAQMLQAFDDLHELHLCNTFRDARDVQSFERGVNVAAITRGLGWIQHWTTRLEKEEIVTVLPAFLTTVYQNASGSLDDSFERVIELFHRTLDDFDSDALKGFSSSEQGQLFLALLGEQILATPHSPQAIDLLGWLELPWEDAPHLIITGMNEGFVPETIQGHPWLPNSARRIFGLRDNEQRQSRDAYLLASLLASRADGGQVDLLFGRTNEREDPLRPSRLLLATPPEELAARVKLIFQPSGEEVLSQPWRMSWQLTPPTPDAESKRLQRLSVTSFSTYLDCPFRFYLSRVLEMGSPDLDRIELNPRDFGNVIHQVLEDFATSGAASSSDEKVIAEAFDDLLSTLVTARYGSRLSAPLILQTESMRQRLQWWAESEARHREEGWQILSVEDYLAPKETPFQIAGMPINGMIDRIEQHPKLGIRVLDFKTKRKPTPVIDAHIAKIPRLKTSEDYPEWTRLDLGGKPHHWINLQVPLYVLALAERYPALPAEQLTAGYVQLGMAKKDIYLDLWDGISGEVLDSARDCARGVIEAIQGHVFWPPNESPGYDDFHSILFGDPESAVDARNLIPSSPSA